METCIVMTAPRSKSPMEPWSGFCMESSIAKTVLPWNIRTEPKSGGEAANCSKYHKKLNKKTE